MTYSWSGRLGAVWWTWGWSGGVVADLSDMQLVWSTCSWTEDLWMIWLTCSCSYGHVAILVDMQLVWWYLADLRLAWLTCSWSGKHVAGLVYMQMVQWNCGKEIHIAPWNPLLSVHLRNTLSANDINTGHLNASFV